MSSMFDNVLNKEYNTVTHTEKEFFWKFSYTMFGCELELELEFNNLNGLKQH